MLYIFYGPDYYRKNKKIGELVNSIKLKGSQFEKEKFYLDEDGQLEKLKEFIVSQNLFGSKNKVAIVSGCRK
jgi:DNA polymerase III delta subunit